jgi:hypothetical protein
MSLPGIASVVFGLAFIAFGVAHELTWFRRRRGAAVKGVVVEIIKDHSPSEYQGEGGPYYYPRIEYSIGSETRCFVSKYGTGNPAPVGTFVDVLVSSESKDAEVLTSGNRLICSVIPIAFGLLYIVTGFGIRP